MRAWTTRRAAGSTFVLVLEGVSATRISAHFVAA